MQKNPDGSVDVYLWTTVAAAPGKVVVRVGTLDSMEGLQPQTETIPIMRRDGSHRSQALHVLRGVNDREDRSAIGTKRTLPPSHLMSAT